MTGAEADSSEAQPNVWVAHLRDGIQAVGLHTGRTVCKLHLASPGLHVDLNGDGVLDHLQVTGHGAKGKYRTVFSSSKQITHTFCLGENKLSL